MKIGRQSIKFENTPSIVSAAAIVGPKEKNGPLSHYFDLCLNDVYFEENTFEKAEKRFMQETIKKALLKCEKDISQIDFAFAGDLLNQCISSGYAFRDFDVPFFGIYGACSTFSEANILASMMIDAGYANLIIASASSHFCSAEKQFRMPLLQGTQTPPTGQWTVTGAGTTIISNSDLNTSNFLPKITYATPGKVIDLGIDDVANMGAAMAPAAFDTLLAHFEDTSRDQDYYDIILTGDLGKLGSEILVEQLKNKGYDISKVHKDAGILIFDFDSQGTNMGGSGCGCMASVFSSYIYKSLLEKKINKALIVSTGALMSPISLGQKESIPGIAHAFAVENI